MNKLSDWSLAQKLQDSKCKGIIIGIAIAAFVLLTVVAVIVKIKLMKQLMHGGGCCCDADMFEDDFMDEDECLATEKDFV